MPENRIFCPLLPVVASTVPVSVPVGARCSARYSATCENIFLCFQVQKNRKKSGKISEYSGLPNQVSQSLRCIWSLFIVCMASEIFILASERDIKSEKIGENLERNVRIFRIANQDLRCIWSCLFESTIIYIGYKIRKKQHKNPRIFRIANQDLQCIWSCLCGLRVIYIEGYLVLVRIIVLW